MCEGELWGGKGLGEKGFRKGSCGRGNESTKGRGLGGDRGKGSGKGRYSELELRGRETERVNF